jgi:hypothetical protein
VENEAVALGIVTKQLIELIDDGGPFGDPWSSLGDVFERQEGSGP